jgi:ketosteroid isomerase-like protein
VDQATRAGGQGKELIFRFFRFCGGPARQRRPVSFLMQPVRVPVDSLTGSRKDRCGEILGRLNMTREQMLQVMGACYAARVGGDVDRIVAAFSPDAKFTLNATPPQACVAVDTSGCDSMRTALGALVDAFEFQKLDIVDSVVEGSKAAIRIRFTVKSRATGRTAVTESLDLVEFRDGKVASYTQFFDSAIADRLTAK